MRVKVVLSVISLLFTGSVLAIHVTQQIYPWASLFIIGSVICIIYISSHLSIISGIPIILLTGLAYRFLLYNYPATLIGLDSDRHAAAINRIIDTGSLSSITDLYFYSESPIFYSYGSILSVVMGVEGQYSVLSYPIAITLIIPLTVVGFLSTKYNLRIVIIGSAISVSMGSTLIESVTPRPSLHALAIFVVMLLLLDAVVDQERKSLSLILVLLLLTTVVTITHKLPTFLFILVLLCVFIIILYEEWGSVGYTLQKSALYSQYKIKIISYLLVFSSIILLLHWIFVTVFFSSVVNSALLPLLDPDVGSPTIAYSGARPASPGYMGILNRNIYWIGIIPIAFTCWVIGYKIGVSRVLLGAVAAIYSMALLPIVAPISASTRRIFAFADPLTALLITVSAVAAISILVKEIEDTTISKWAPNKNILIVVFFSLVVITQIGGGVAVPDHPDETRYYLTEGEVVSKEFASSKSQDSVYTDSFFARQNTNFGEKGDREDVVWRSGSGRTPADFMELEKELLNNELSTIDGEYILHRTNVNVYRYNGYWELNYDPINVFEEGKTQKIYSNGHSNLYYAEGGL